MAQQPNQNQQGGSQQPSRAGGQEQDQKQAQRSGGSTDQKSAGFDANKKQSDTGRSDRSTPSKDMDEE